MIESINGVPVTADLLNEAGIITGLEKDQEYDITYYLGTYYNTGKIKADTHFLRCFEVYTVSDRTITKNGYISLKVQPDLMSGYYRLGNSGFFRYLDYVKGEQELVSTDYNEPYYDTKEEQKEAMNTYTAFFNTEPQVGSIIVGITAGLEEAKANGNEDIDAEAINGIRAGLMGPLAGIGDSLVVGTLIPILLGIALGLSTGGSVVGPIFYIVAWNLIMAFGMKFLYFKGYELGGKAVDILVGEQATAIREAIVMLGTMVVGSVAALSLIHI